MQDKKEGLIVIVVSIALGGIALVLSKGWGTANPLWLFTTSIDDYVGRDTDFVLLTSHVIAALILLFAYGVLIVLCH